ncbi:DUF6281 family protein [Streptomyces niveiscabiei]|uniref:DUF6281 family protein n=1 Tax=Streptomyces niveiscabiei TaxID=164115 RepID=UPI0029A9AC6A|nr:DUF6281 family protein [Streptomyces niveiscabiei]MDX3383501.1 DUF6281 family protein [Streptomyces niveiscabiei]
MRAAVSRFAVLLAVGAGAVLSGGCAAGNSDAGSCASAADFGGRRYSGPAGAEFTLGEAVGTAVLPACDDTGGDDDPGIAAREVRAYAVAGVDPSVAIVVDGSTETLLVAMGARGQLPVEVRALLTREPSGS